MDAVKFIKAWERMCNSYNSCHECPLKDETCSLAFGGINSDKIVPTVEQWAKEHPIKTRQSVFLEQWPNAELDTYGCIDICPKRVTGEKRSNNGYGCKRFCPDCHREFWMQEVE